MRFEGALEGDFLHVIKSDDPNVRSGAIPTDGCSGLLDNLRHLLRVGEALWSDFHDQADRQERQRSW